RQLGVSHQMLHSILRKRSAVSPEMAVRLDRFCSNGAAFWLQMQASHDLWHAERKLRNELSKIPEHTAA
ncbi:MAG TPA: HigA family addiction module antitoxin, partial [Rubrobacter sp.]|nr:HigA family addiction module antitoxin [Rubrobacter sp.]